MKKWLVALLGIFMVFGSCIFSACNQETAKLTLSQESVSIEIRSDELGSGEAIIFADVSGAEKYSITASASGYDEYITVSTSQVSNTRTNITIKGVSENDTPSVVTVRVAPGNIEKYIYVDVYSQIQSIKQNTNLNDVKDNYLVKGTTTTLNADKLLTIEPVKARKDITWSFDGTFAGATLSGNNITISETFSGESIKLKATASNGVSSAESIIIPVLDKIEEDVSLRWSYNQNSSFSEIKEGNNEFTIVPNLASDEKYNGFVIVDYIGNLNITGYAVDINGNPTEDIVVNRYGEYNGLPLFRISTMQGKTNINGQYKVGFKIGYADYNYAFDTMLENAITINSREKVNDIIVSNNQSPDIEGSTQTLYSNYVDSASATSYGHEFNVSITPTTVIDASNKYSITVSRTQAGMAISNGCPVDIWYRDKHNSNRWTQVVMANSGGDYVILGDNFIDATTIYIKASDNLLVQSAEGVRISFRSIDNPVISTFFDVKLIKSVSVENFTFENGDFLIDSSAKEGNITLKKQFTLEGQTSIEGLYIINNSSAVTFEDIQYVSNDDSSVTFEITLTLNKSSYGITRLDTYQIAHRNGLTSEKMNIDIFLPLKDVGINHNSGENLSNSVTDVEYSNKTYSLALVGTSVYAQESTSTQSGVSRLMLKNDTTTPISYTYNSVNGNYADATLMVGFLDYEQLQKQGISLEDFKNLSNSQEGVSTIVSLALLNQNKSNVAYFTNDFASIITKGTGYTYAVVYFYGKGVEGDKVLARTILIESYIAPNSMNIIPESDKNITLYSLDSLATTDSQLTRKTINIRFANTNVTYSTIDNLEFASRNVLMGARNVTGNTVTWTDGRYSLSNVAVTGDGISFNIEVVGTFGEPAFYDTLDVHYVIRNDADNKVYDIYLPINLTIKNAQRVESLKWKNADEEGLYFEIGDLSPQYLMMETLPTNAKNSDIHYIRTNGDGTFIDRNTKFVSVNDEIATNVLAINLSTEITSGMTGYIYLLPADAVYNNQIKYYYVEKDIEKQGIINDSMLGNLKDSASGMTYYDYLVANAYFKSNASDSNEVKNISFADIIVRIKIEVADGSSFEHAYRIYDAQGFAGMKDNLYYTVVNSIDLTGERYNQISSFKGGLQGAKDDVVIKLAGNGFANELASEAEVRNIIFTGSVDGDSFVASVNNGKITNVKVEADGIYPSNLNVSNASIYAGGLVGTNNGTISYSSVLGLNINSSNSSVGGLAGINYGTIENSRVEFYNLAVAGEVDLYSSNKFKGANVGAFVGIVGANSSIYRTFAYNYSADESVLVATTNNVGAFAGSALTNSPSTTIIDYSFAFIGLSNALNNANYVTLTNYYLAYIDGGGNYKVDYVEHYDTNPNFVTAGESGYESYVNNGKAHLYGLMQDKKVESVDYNIATSKDNNGFYKSVAVGDKQGIMFAYTLKSGANDLTPSEINDLNELNSISLSQLVNKEANKNIITTSSNPNIIKVVGSTLKVLKTGKVTLTLSSKQDVEINKEIEISVVYPLSNMQISWTNAYGNINYVKDNSTLTIQKTRSRDFIVGYEKTNVFLGSTANSYNLVENNVSLAVAKMPEDSTAVGHEITSATSFKLTANENSAKTSFVVSPHVFEDSVLQNAVASVFQRKFAVQAIDGVISFGVSGQELPITPSSNTTVKVEIKTTDKNDGLIPVISFNNEKLTIITDGTNKFEYAFARDVVNPLTDSKTILTAVVEKIASSTDGELHTFVYNVDFSVSPDYQANIPENMDFEVYFESESGNDSKEWDGSFILALTRQNFTRLDAQTRKIEYSQYISDADLGLAEVHTTGEAIAVLAPGNSAIMQININPTFAYFDYVDFSYSFGEEIVVDAVSIQIVEPYGTSGNKFTSRKIDGAIEEFASKLRYTPTAEEKARGVIYYKLWINTTVEKDSRITFTASFYDSNNAKPISFVNTFLTISYLTQPIITVDGLSTAYLAKGASAEVKIDVLPDQEVDTVTVDGVDIKGINITELSEPKLDEDRGIKTYTATLSASVLASAGGDVFSIQAQVSRELNGSKEYKSSVATVVLVDFKIAPDDISITGANEDNLTVWQGVPKALNVEYTLLPEKYNSSSDSFAQSKIKELEKAREDFLKYEYYPAIEEAKDSRYLINYLYDENGNIATDEKGNAKPENLEERLFYVIGNSRVNITDTSVDSPVKFSYDDKTNKMSVIGTKLAGSVKLVLLTYVSAGGYTATYEKYFTLTVTTWSSEDLPTTISNASEFEALNPLGQTNITPNDYILTNDIVLENYTPFDTRAIKSLDGNGYTIYIKSFNTKPENTSTLNLALFKTVVSHNLQGELVPTTLKNIRVNLYNGGQVTVNVNKYKTINIAGLAITNEGIITNCEVVSFYTEASAMGQIIPQPACTLHNKDTGINVTYIAGENTTEKVFHDGGADWSSEIAGFVLNNSGSITNSRVGGDKVIIVGDEQLIDGETSGYTYASYQQLDTFNIVGQGNLAGFVLTNAGGYIASSFAKNIAMDNQSNSTSFYVAGFVGVNTSSIITSYVEGVESDKQTLGADYSQFAKEGSSIKSQKGVISGFIYSNTGSVKDSYSNILIANSIDSNNVYLASGFVYMNEGALENCYSASQIKNSVFTQMNFSGVKADGELLAKGTYTNCYFFNKAYEHLEEVNDTTTESRYSTGALLIPNPTETSYFYGFAIAGGETDGIWRINEEDGITLIEPNNISISHRYICYTDEEYEGTTAENEQGEYILPYATLTFLNSSLEINTALGGKNNPIIVVNAQDWLDVTGLSKSTYISEYYNSTSIWGTYRLVNNIDLSTVASSDSSVKLPSSEKAFSGILYGNGFEISGISITSDEPDDVAFGLFASIEKRDSYPIITNVKLNVEQVIAGDTAMVGALAGYIKDANIINIKLRLNSSSLITGRNFAGSLAGFAFGNNIIKNIIVENPSVTADRYSNETQNDYFKADSLKTFRANIKNNLSLNASSGSAFLDSIRDCSYAGGVVGFVDNFMVDSPEFDYVQHENFSINNIRITGTVRIQGQVAGGGFGLLGYQTNIRDVGLIVEGNSANNSSYILATKYFAGGIAGQSFGSISRTFASHEKEVQDLIEDNMSNFYDGNKGVERGILNLFYVKGVNYTQKYIGGLVGYAGSGNIEISYSKLNVTSPSASYAGGIIGGMELNSASAYLVGEKTLAYNEKTFTKYFFNEVYATGDVRANTAIEDSYAGGIVGLIQGDASRVGFLAVNGFNYFTTYDYGENKYNSLNAGQTNVSNNFKVNSLVGRFKDSDGKTVLVDSSNIEIHNSYLTLMTAYESQNGEGGNSEKAQIPSVAVYENYIFEGMAVRMSLFESDITAGESNPTLDQLNQKVVYIITGPSSYSSSTTGHTYTQVGFLNSGAWNSANWGHPIDELFPEIKYKRSSDVLYLDCYNVKEVFEKMSQNNYRVVVRGLVAEGAEEYEDINLDDVVKNIGGEYPVIEAFSGKLEGGLYKTTVGKEDVKIIASQNFIKSTGPGFYVSGVTVEYNAQEIGLDNGLFVNSEINESTINNLTVIINGKVKKSKISDTEDIDIGLIAPAIKSTSINNVKIVANKVSDGESLLNIESTATRTQSASVSSPKANIGLIAGKIVQGSSISIMQINEISIETTGGLIAVNEQNIQREYQIGGYFGKTERDAKIADAQELRLNLSQYKITNEGKLSSAKFAVNVNSGSSVSLGGYVGHASGISYVATQDSETINASFEYNIGNSLNTLYVGGLFGQNSSASSLTINGQASNVDTTIITTQGEIISNLSAGGFAGKIETGKVVLTNFANFNMAMFNSAEPKTVAGKELQETLNNTDYMNGGEVQTENANVGVVLGEASSQFEFVGNVMNPTGLNLDGQAIKLKGPNISYGSVVGYANSMRSGSIEESETNPTLKITGKVISNAQVFVDNGSADGTIALGGIVGQINVVDGKEISSEAIIGNESSLLRFDGAFYLNSKKTTVGGILGSYTNTTNNSNSSLSILKTSFGGAVKLYGGNSNGGNLTVGGTLGFANINDTASANASVTVKNNYNYGDVFVEYGNNGLTILGSESTENYVFGGVIGGITQGTYSVLRNYSLTTSHNSKHSSVSNRHVKAIIGSGTVASEITNNNNFYNHAVTLTTDDNAVDCGYISSYTDTIQAYNGTEYSKADAVVSVIKNALALRDLKAGHKLNPSSNDDKGILPTGVGTFNGITYYTMSNTINNASLTKDDNLTLENVALIGDGTTVNYTVESQDCRGLVDTLSGHSYISGFILNANLKIESEETETANYGALVGTMKGNSIVYAINAQGTIDVGGKSALNVSGLVGQMESGKIYDCSSDLDVTYRAGHNGNVSGLTSSKDDFTLIERSYVGGSIKTMITANVYAFANGNGNTTIKHSYTFAKLDRHDYTNEIEALGTVNVFGAASLQNAYYDEDGFNIIIKEENITKNSKAYSVFNSSKVDTSLGFDSGDWEVSYDFNYGYPTLKYGYLKRSSYAEREEKAEGTGYDAYVLNGEFTRLANGVKPANDEFFMIPNGAVFNNIANIAGTTTTEGITTATGKYALLYDIDTSATSLTSNAITFSGYLDGRDKTISNLNNRLFNTINNATIRNLRLTDVVLDVGGALANTVENKSTISNMTLSGFISTTEKLVGGLANNATDCEINTITNLIDIKVLGRAGVTVGGLLGEQAGGEILYSSNYGPITVTGGGNSSVGGLVGKTMSTGSDGVKNSSSINYSYNATSVLNNYATSSQLMETTGKFYTGGLVGYGFDTNINNSYNSGMIKSGNKSNNSGSYAGGILGYGSDKITIDNCYNEGTVEALGVNPTFTWAYEKNDDTGNTLALTLRTDSDTGRNVWAYGIGYVASGTVQNSSVRMATGTEVSDETIYNNGAYLPSETLIKYWKWSEIEEHLTDDTSATLEGMRYAFIGVSDYYFRDVCYEITCHVPDTKETPNLIVTSINELEMPTSFILETYIDVSLTTKHAHWVGALPILGTIISALDGFKTEADGTKEGKVYENFTCKYNDVTSSASGPKFDYYSKLDSNKDGQERISNINSTNQIGDTVDGSAIVNAIRSQQEDSGEETIILINGTEYTTVDKNNQKTIFNAGVYTVKGQIVSESLACLGNTKYYSISVGDNDVDASINSVYQNDEGKTVVEYTLVSATKITEGLTITVTANYEEEIVFNTSSMKYLYVDNHSIGIDLDIKNYNVLNGYTLTTKGGIIYDKIIKVSIDTDYSQQDQPQDTNSSLMYLAISDSQQDVEDEKKISGKIIYAPNAELKFNHTTVGTVNTHTQVPDNLASGDGFIQNINKIIDFLKNNNHKFYSRYESDETFMKEIKFTDGSSCSVDITANDEKTVSDEISYGKTVNISPNIEYIEVKSTEEVVDEETGETSTIEVVSDRYYQVSLSCTENVIALNSSNSPVMSYNSSNGKWYTSFNEIASLNLTIDETDNTFVLRSDAITENSYEDSIREFFAGLKFIGNTATTSVSFADQFGDITQGETIYANIGMGNGNEFQYNLVREKSWAVIGANEYSTSGTNITVSSEQISKTAYTLNGITIYYGSQEIKATQSYTTRISDLSIGPEIDMEKDDSDHSYYEVCLTDTNGKIIKNSSNQECLKTGYATGLAGLGNWGAEWIDQDFVTLTAKVYGTYKITSDDKETITIVTTGKSNNFIYVEGILENDDDKGITISVGQCAEASNGENILVMQSVQVLANQNGETQTVTSYQVNGQTILGKVEQNGSETYYRYFDSEGDRLTETKDDKIYQGESFTPSDDTDIYFKKGLSIKFKSLNDMNCYQLYQNSVKYKEDETGNYVVLDPQLDESSSNKISFEDVTYIYNTAIERADYGWEEFAMPTYSTVERSPAFADKNKVEITTTDGSGLPLYITVGATDSKVTMHLKDSSENFEYVVKATLKDGYNTADGKTTVASEEPSKAKHIILADDVSFTPLDNSFNKSAEINMYGNGYYISYYGNSFYTNLYGSNSYIRDVKYLGETYSTPLLVSMLVDSTNLRNIELYGSVVNLDNTDDSLTNIALIRNSGSKSNISNLKSFASVNSVDKYRVTLISSTIEVTMVDASTSSATNFGIIVAPRGANRASGNNGSSYSGYRNGKNGGNGGNGISIAATDGKNQTNVFNNKGILRVGDGGNGGSGGSSHRGADRLNSKNLDQKGGTAGAGGKAGECGKISGFAESTGLGENGVAGIGGATSREGFGYIKVEKIKQAFGLEDPFIRINSKDVDYNGYSYYDKGGTAENIYEALFDLSTKQALPAQDVWGNSKTSGGSNAN